MTHRSTVPAGPLERGVPIVIAGAGIGGLTTALSLHRAGFTNVRLLEAASAERELGVGLNLLPNAVRELAELGLLPLLSGRSVLTSTLELRHRAGGMVWREPRGLDAGYAWPQLSIHRGILIEELRAAVDARLGAGAVRTNARVLRAEGPAGAVRITVRDLATGEESIERAALAIGADGIRSALRAQHHPDEGDPATNGLTLWRGAAWCERFADGRTMRVVGDDRRRLVVYPILQGDRDRVLTNWVMTVPTADAERVAPRDRAMAAAASFDGWVTPGVRVDELIAATEDVVAHPMVDRDPIHRWVHGGSVLLGDAAHPMYPAGSNGATQAIIDARVLARRLVELPPAFALAAYEEERRPRLSEIQRANRRLGPEVAISLAHQRAPEGFDDISEVFDADELRAISERYAEIGGFTPEELNGRPSLDPPRYRSVA